MIRHIYKRMRADVRVDTMNKRLKIVAASTLALAMILSASGQTVATAGDTISPARPVSYRLAQRDGRRVIEASTGHVIPWAGYACIIDSSTDRWMEKLEVFLDAGVSLFQLHVWQTSGGSYWDNAFFSLDGKPLDEPRTPISWSQQTALLIERNPDARFIMCFGMNADPAWRSAHRQHFQAFPPGGGPLKDGISILGSIASELYLERMELMIRDTIRWCERQPWRDRIVGYSIFPYGEGTLEIALFDALFDNSPVMHAAFKTFLTAKYGTDAALQAAWDDPSATLASLSLPTRTEWLAKKEALKLMHWPEPRQVRRERDYFELQKQLFHRFWSRIFDTMNEATAARPCIKGYDILKQQLQGWLHNAAFDARWEPDTMDTYTHVLLASGSMGVGPLLDHPGLDILQTPGMYYNRAMGYAWEAEGLSDSLTLRGKANAMEADLRTWVRKGSRRRPLDLSLPIDDAGVFMTPEEMRAGFLRTHAWALTRNQMYYFTSVSGANWWYHEQPVAAQVAALAAPPLRADELPWSNTLDAICLVLDDEAALYEDFSSGFQNLAVYRQIEEGLALCGVPYRIHLLSDLERDDFPAYKAYFFPNLFMVDKRVEALLRDKVLKNGRLAIFGPGTGVTDGERLSAQGATRLLGVPMELQSKRTARRVILQNHGHPISAELDTVTFGDSYSYGPLLVPSVQRLEPHPVPDTDSSAPVPSAVTPLGAGFYHYFLDRPGPFVADFGRGAAGASKTEARENGDYSVVFVPAVPIPPEFLRACARYAGCHVWSERNAVVYASGNLAALHVGGVGEYVLRLPQPAVATDLTNGERTDGPVESIILDATGPTTRIFRLE